MDCLRQENISANSRSQNKLAVSEDQFFIIFDVIVDMLKWKRILIVLA